MNLVTLEEVQESVIIRGQIFATQREIGGNSWVAIMCSGRGKLCGLSYAAALYLQRHFGGDVEMNPASNGGIHYMVAEPLDPPKWSVNCLSEEEFAEL